MLTLDSVLAKIDAFLADTGMSATAFGKAAVGDPNLVRDLRTGRMPGLRLIQKVDGFMRDRPASEPQKRVAS